MATVSLTKDALKDLTAALAPFDVVEGINLADRPACSAADISAWESRAEVRIPNDLRAFLQSSSNGFQLRWHVRLCGKSVRLGCMHIAGLDELKPVPAAAFVDALGHSREPLPLPDTDVLHAIELDASTPHGRVCLLYASADPSQAQVHRRLLRELLQLRATPGSRRTGMPCGGGTRSTSLKPRPTWSLLATPPHSTSPPTRPDPTR